MFTLYEVEEDSEVGVIFEVMNDRGKPLSQLEKVKNFLLYMTDNISDGDVSRKGLADVINSSWKQILETQPRLVELTAKMKTNSCGSTSF